MAGHSHWANIARKKAVNDAKRGRLFSKLARRIIICAKQGGGDPEKNLQLFYAIEEAKAANMPNNTIDNAVKKGSGQLDDPTAYESLTYEGYGPGGVAILVEAVTDNRNRTAPEIRRTFDKRGGSIGAPGSVVFKFDLVGLFTVPKDAIDEDTLTLLAADAGASEVTPIDEDGVWEIICPVEAFAAMRKALVDQGLQLQMAEVTRIPQLTVDVDADKAESIIALMDELNDNDDVQKVYTDAKMV